MRVLVIGANGSVGKHTVEKLKESEHDPVAMVRKTEQVPYFEQKGIETVLADLEKDFERAYHNVDAVIFAAGSGPHTGADKTVLIDQEGAIEAVDIAKRFGVKKFIMLSSIGADKPKEAEQIKYYLYAKHRADEHLKQSGLTYSILRPGILTNDPGTGKVELQDKLPEIGKIPREDVAALLVQLLTEHKADNKIFEAIEGSTDISKVL
ncbi:SDR family oxidoreductase [Virgibacillus kekensis]|uniref:SDR family oxidoreductase n=1 Tax=Virgibacillus kekensis TaxID=202261 RepID=A0ABV9DMP4_9BACI